MFSDPVIDKEKSIKLVLHILKVEGEYIPTLELVYPNEDSLNLESLMAIRDGIDYSQLKINKVLDSLL